MQVTSTQIGAIAENLISNALIVESDGRFSPFSPMADDDGIDLLVYDKTTGRAVPLQVKSRRRTLRAKKGGRGNIVHFEVRRTVLKDDRYSYLLAVLLSDLMTGIDRAWLIPMCNLPKIANARETKYVMRASRSAKSRDKYWRYRCQTMKEVTVRLEGLFDEL